MRVGLPIASDVTLMAAAAGDARTLFELRNDPFTVQFSGSRKPVIWEDHVKWFTERLARPQDNRLFFVRNGTETIGVLRFERRDPHAAVIGIYLVSSVVGRGIGTAVIRAGCALIFRLWKIDRVEAHVITENERSARAFMKAGFVQTPGAASGDEGWSLVLARPIPGG